MKRNYNPLVHKWEQKSRALAEQVTSRRIENVCEHLRLLTDEGNAALPKPLPSLHPSPSMEIRMFALFSD